MFQDEWLIGQKCLMSRGCMQVEVIDTDLKGLKGRVTSVLDDGRVEMQPTDPGLEVLTFEAKQLRKHFEVRCQNAAHC